MGNSCFSYIMILSHQLDVYKRQARITVDQTSHHLTAGEVIVMPAEIPHAVEALTPFKMLLILIKG